MTSEDPAVRAITTVEDSARGYFETVHKLQFPFWRLPLLTTGGKVLTGAFATLLIGFAQWHMGQDVGPGQLGVTVVLAFFYIVLICGLSLFFDRQRADGDFQKLVSVVCGGVTLGCALVVLDRVFPWINPAWQMARPYHLSSPAAYLLVAVFSSLAVGVLLWLNTVFQSGLRDYFRDGRALAWTLGIWAIVCLGIWLIVGASHLGL